MAGGLRPTGPRFEANRVGMKPSKKTSFLTAKMEGNGNIMLVDDVLDNLNINQMVYVFSLFNYNYCLQIYS